MALNNMHTEVYNYIKYIEYQKNSVLTTKRWTKKKHERIFLVVVLFNYIDKHAFGIFHLFFGITHYSLESKNKVVKGDMNF